MGASDTTVAPELKHTKRFSAALSHDLNNYSGAIQGYVELLRLDLAEDEEASLYLQRIQDACQRIVGRTSMLEHFAENRSCRGATCDLTSLVKRFAAKQTSPPPIVDVEASAEGRWVEGDADILDKVLEQLTLNAREASPADAPVYLQIASEPPNILIKIRDQGEGMDQETQEQIFYPYFSKKGKARGFGLAWVHGWVGSCGGSIKVVSAPGEGTEVTVRLNPAPC